MLCFLFYALLCAQHVVALNVTVDLGYARYRGKNIGNGVLRYAGMRYARRVSRIDGRRFTPPQDPIKEQSVMDATSFGPLCIGSSTVLTAEFGDKSSEDCLFINVFAPENATSKSALPVYVFVQGGGFNNNGNADFDGTDLIDASNASMVVVNFNYRVGPYGFLASKEVVANQSLALNNGLRDQRQALKWVKDHIKEFGGDPDHVTLGGPSAGAGSIVLQLTAFGGRDDKLFHAVAAESAAFPPLRNVTTAQWQYDALLKQTKCADLACLTSMDAITFQTAVRNLKLPFPGGKNPPIYFWNPTLDYDFIRDYTYNELQAGHFVKVPAIFGDSTNEGLQFTPKDVSSLSSAKQFVIDQFPSVNWDQIRTVWNAKDGSSNSMQWRQFAGDIFGHIRYNCPSLNISSAYAAHSTAPSYHYRWDVGGAGHVGELLPIWHNATSAAGVFVHAYWVSFIKSYNPNTYRAEFLAANDQKIDSPEWTTFDKGMRMRFDDANNVTMEGLDQYDSARCSVVTNMGVQLERSIPSFAARSYIPSCHVAVGVMLLALVPWLAS